jgi:hypothetical protein
MFAEKDFPHTIIVSTQNATLYETHMAMPCLLFLFIE